MTTYELQRCRVTDYQRLLLGLGTRPRSSERITSVPGDLSFEVKRDTLKNLGVRVVNVGRLMTHLNVAYGSKTLYIDLESPL